MKSSKPTNVLKPTLTAAQEKERELFARLATVKQCSVSQQGARPN